MGSCSSFHFLRLCSWFSCVYNAEGQIRLPSLLFVCNFLFCSPYFLTLFLCCKNFVFSRLVVLSSFILPVVFPFEYSVSLACQEHGINIAHKDHKNYLWWQLHYNILSTAFYLCKTESEFVCSLYSISQRGGGIVNNPEVPPPYLQLF